MMLSERVLVAVALLPIGLAFIFWGVYPFAVLVAAVVALASWEYGRLFRAGAHNPAAGLLVAGSAILALTHASGKYTAPLLVVLLFLAAGYHLRAFERGNAQAATDYAITFNGIVYFGFLGAYLVRLRALPGGIWWLLLVLPVVWVADSAAYFVGRTLGSHALSPRLSPKKTWEGYLGGILGGILGGALLAAGYGAYIQPEIRIWHGVVLGGLLSVLTPLGDLTESMFKRQFGVKDSSHLLPGHGGVWDRIDSWLWAAPLGYYVITLVFL